jgi:hypothetical protein
MGEDPDRIRREIEQTRDDMSETVGAIGYKADVKTRAKESLQDKKESAVESVTSVKGVAQENPVGLAIGSIAVGFVAGLLFPATRVEDEKLGRASDDVVDRVKQTGQEALDRGKDVAQEAAQAAQEAARESGQQHAEGLKSSAQEHAEAAASEART